MKEDPFYGFDEKSLHPIPSISRKQLENTLRETNSRIKPFLGDGVTPTYTVKYKNKIGTIFKPDGSNGNLHYSGPANAMSGVMSSITSDFYSIGVVPKTVMASHVIEGESISGSEQLFIPNQGAIKKTEDVNRIKIDLLDFLTSNFDRHRRNILVDSKGHLVAIDNEFSFFNGVNKLYGDNAESNWSASVEKHYQILENERGVNFEAGTGVSNLLVSKPKLVREFLNTNDGKTILAKLRSVKEYDLKKYIKNNCPQLGSDQVNQYARFLYVRQKNLAAYLEKIPD